MITWKNYQDWMGPVLHTDIFPKTSCPPISAWCTDSRQIKSGDWFIPISGEKFDGHNFIEQALSKGALGFIYDAKKTSLIPVSCRDKGIAVKDTLNAFQKMTQGWRDSLKHLSLAALTGSSGKTTTKELLGLALMESGPTFATQASFNNEIGVPKTLQQLKMEHRFAAVEFGARMPGNIAFLCEMASPNVAGLLNVGSAHLGVFGSFENLLNTKLEIFRNSPKDCFLVPNADDKQIFEAAKSTGKRILSFGFSEHSDVRILNHKLITSTENLGVQLPKMLIDLQYEGKKSSLIFDLAHEKLPINVAAAMAMALASGAKRENIEKGLIKFRGVRGRYHTYNLRNFVLIDDTYNANPASVVAGFKTLANTFPKAEKIVVIGDMLELGEMSAKEHTNIGMLAVDMVQPRLLITVGSESRHVAEGARLRGFPNSRIKSYANVDEILKNGLHDLENGEVIYAKGSNSMKITKIIDIILEREGSKNK